MMMMMMMMHSKILKYKFKYNLIAFKLKASEAIYSNDNIYI